MKTSHTVSERYEQVKKEITSACERSHRAQDDINVIAVTKYVGPDVMKEVLDAGIVHIGENRWQDAKEKWELLGNQGIWHFIGHLQTNKVKDVIGKFKYIHSLDRPSLAKEIEKRASALNEIVRCFIQVNVSGEETKYGLPPEQLFSFAEQIRDMKHIQVIGLMTMAPHEENPELTRPVFCGLRELRDELNHKAILRDPVTELSMGMSNDYIVAIEEGATWIRLGSVLTRS